MGALKRLFYCSVVLHVFLVSADKAEYRLYQDLEENYSNLERPVSNHSEPVQIRLGLLLQQIINVDEKNQVVEVNGWVKLTWKDYKMQWDPQLYSGIRDIRYEAGQIWNPDVLIYNSVDPRFDSTYPSNMVVHYDGTVIWRPPGILRISCKMDITWFPFDDQSCHLKFGSWTYHGFALDLQPEDKEKGMDTSQYIESGEWLLLGTPVMRSIKYYDCCPEPYPDVKFYLNIRRKTLYYGFNLIIPSLLISLMSLLGFTMPPDACEKITLEITILLSVCFFLSIVGNMTPPTSEALPLIGTFFTCCMMVVSLSVVFTVVVINLHFRTPDTHEMSGHVRAILLNWLPWLLMMKRPGHKFTKASIIRSRSASRSKHSESLLRNIRCMENVTDLFRTSPNPLGHMSRLSSTIPFMNPGVHKEQSIELEKRIRHCMKPLLESGQQLNPGVNALLLTMQLVLSKMKFITKRMDDEDKYSEAENDWKFAAMVVDRLCLVMFTAFIIASTCGIMLSAPHLIV